MNEFAPGTNFKYTTIRSHPYFETFDWSLLESGSMPSPHTPCTPRWLEVPDEELTDGAMELESYFLDGEATPLTIAEPTRGAQGVEGGSNRTSNVEDERWMEYVKDLQKGEELVKTGRIHKRKGFFARERQLVLTSLPRLIYVDPATKEYKGTIPWTPQHPVSVKIVGDAKFDVVAVVDGEGGKKRAYHLYAKDKEDRDEWAKAIRELL